MTDPEPTDIETEDQSPTVPDVLLEGLTQGERDRVIAAHSRMEDCDRSFPGSLAIVLCNAARCMAGIFRKNAEILRNTPAMFADMIQGVDHANRANNDFLEEAKGTVEELERTAAALSQEAQSGQLDRVWLHRWMIGFGAGCLILSAWATLECRITRQVAAQIQTDRFEIVARGEELLKLQKLAIERAQINAEADGFRESWRALRAEWDRQATPELERRRAELEAYHADLKSRTQALISKEDSAYGKTTD